MVIRYLFPFSITIFLREWQFDTMDEDFVDFALVKLDREVKNRPRLKLRQSEVNHLKTNLITLGFPSGLPMKVTF